MAYASNQAFSKQCKLIKTDEFSSVFDFRRRIKGQYFDLYYKPNQCLHNRLGLVVSKKVAKPAVQRNYMRRVLRELFRSHHTQYHLSYDMIIRVKKRFARKEYSDVSEEFETLIARLK